MIKGQNYLINTKNGSGSLVVLDFNERNILRKKFNMEPLKIYKSPFVLSNKYSKIMDEPLPTPKEIKKEYPTVKKNAITYNLEEPQYKLSRPRPYLIQDIEKITDNYVYFLPIDNV